MFALGGIRRKFYPELGKSVANRGALGSATLFASEGYRLRRYIVPLLNVYGCPQADGKLEPQKTTAND
jgi:hypothetical protein